MTVFLSPFSDNFILVLLAVKLFSPDSQDLAAVRVSVLVKRKESLAVIGLYQEDLYRDRGGPYDCLHITLAGEGEVDIRTKSAVGLDRVHTFLPHPEGRGTAA